VPQAGVLRSVSIKAGVLLGFGLTLAIWLAAAYGFTLQNQRALAETAAVTARYTIAQEVLASVSSQVLLGSVFTRDAILDAAFDRPGDRRRVEQTFDAIAKSLARYTPVSNSSNEVERVRRLTQEIERVRQWRLELLDTIAQRSPKDALVLLRTQGVPQRDAVIRVAAELQALNREAFGRQHAAITEIFASSERWFWGTLGLAVLASFAIGLVAVRHTGQLENRLQGQLLRNSLNAQELHELSARLIGVQEDERRSIARDLHDEVGQGLMAIKVELAVAQRVIAAGSAQPGLLKGVQTITDGALASVRNLSHLLHPVILDDLGLAAAVETHVRAFERRHQIRIELRQDGLGERLAPEVETAIYRIVQETLTNVAKHARATAGVVSLEHRAGTIVLTVEDNGVGFEPRTGRAAGLGLVGVRERALQVHGTYRIDSGPGQGTKVTVELPATAGPTIDEPDTTDGRTVAEGGTERHA